MRRFISRHVLLPAFETLMKGRRIFHYLRELERTQWWSPAQLNFLQFESLKRLLAHAFENCPYYRDAWSRAGCDPRSLKLPEDFRCWPVIDRTTVSANRMAMRSPQHASTLLSKSTGGSSGEPLHFDLNPDSNDRRCAASHRGYGWAGAGPGNKLLYLWGGTLGEVPSLRRWKDRLYHGLYRRTMLDCFALSEQRVGYFLAEHDRVRPDVLVAYTNALYEFARLLEERGLEPYSPKAIIVGAEKLHGFQRALIERVFRARVFETYGSREFMLIGAECDRHEGLHVTEENLLVEVLDDQGRPVPPGIEGNVAVTDLYNYGMPFVRYLNGDRIVAGWGRCSCGRGLPLMQPVSGRVLDVLQTPDGRRLPGELFPHLMKDFPAVRRFQVVQDAPDHVQLRLVAATPWSEADRAKVERSARAALGPAVQFEIVRVPDIPLTGAGKLRVVVNACPKRGGTTMTARMGADVPPEPVGSVR